LSVLADFCEEQFEIAGLAGVQSEIPIPGYGRTKEGMNSLAVVEDMASARE
jgi:hypothetical protein